MVFEVYDVYIELVDLCVKLDFMKVVDIYSKYFFKVRFIEEVYVLFYFLFYCLLQLKY